MHTSSFWFNPNPSSISSSVMLILAPHRIRTPFQTHHAFPLLYAFTYATLSFRNACLFWHWFNFWWVCWLVVTWQGSFTLTLWQFSSGCGISPVQGSIKLFTPLHLTSLFLLILSYEVGRVTWLCCYPKVTLKCGSLRDVHYGHTHANPFIYTLKDKYIKPALRRSLWMAFM